MALRDRARSLLKRVDESAPRPPVLSFGSWEQFPDTERVIQICHPDWRGVRTAAYAFRSPVVECDNLEFWSDYLLDHMAALDVDTVVIQGWPPGAAAYANRLAEVGIRVKCVLHSSPAQHGAEAGEALVVEEVLELAARGRLAGVGMVKDGMAEAFLAVGHKVTHVPNRSPEMPQVPTLDLGPGLHVGVFAAPFWRKNVVTQLLAVGLLDSATAHVMKCPSVGYLEQIEVVEHGELDWGQFVALQGSVGINLYVTLTECHPLTPIESYLLGVPCLISRTSGVFADDPELWETTTVDRADDPRAIAAAAAALLERKVECVVRARSWIRAADERAKTVWDQFTG